MSKRQQTENNIDDLVKVLKENIGLNILAMPQLQLWARTIFSGNHESSDA